MNLPFEGPPSVQAEKPSPIRSVTLSAQKILADLKSCRNWSDVGPLLDRAKSGKSVRFWPSFWEILCAFTPQYDLETDSVQRRLLEHFGAAGERHFHSQEQARLFQGFLLACKLVFRRNWNFVESDLPFLGEDTIRALSNARESLWGPDEPIVESPPSGDSQQEGAVPELDPKTEIIRNWTHPDFPLWLMNNAVLTETVAIMTGRKPPEGRALHKKLQRVGFRRFRKQPIRGALIFKAGNPSRTAFKGFVYADYVKKKMVGVPEYIPDRETLVGKYWAPKPKGWFYPLGRRPPIDLF